MDKGLRIGDRIPQPIPPGKVIIYADYKARCTVCGGVSKCYLIKPKYVLICPYCLPKPVTTNMFVTTDDLGRMIDGL